jgi:hypothetical protein
MALDTFGGLKTAVATWLNRSDLTSYIPDFVRLAEQRMNYGSEGALQSPPLRIPAMTTTTTGTISGGTIAFPTLFLEPQAVVAYNGTSSWPLEYLAPDRYFSMADSTGLPSFYTYRNNAIYVVGTGAASYRIDYYQAFSSLSADADTNWVLTNAPSLYLYGTLIESAPFLGNDNRVNSWLSLFNAALSAVNRSTKYQGGGALTARVVQ